MDPSFKKVKPSLPPKPSFLNTKNKCKSLSSYHAVRNNRMAARILSSNEAGTNSPPNLSEASPSSEDVFNSSNNVDVVDGNLGAFGRRHFHESERIGRTRVEMHSKSSSTLPVGMKPSLGSDDVAPPPRFLYRSGGTVKVTRTAPCFSQSFKSPEAKMEFVRPATREFNSGKVQGSSALNVNSLEYLVPVISPPSGNPSSTTDYNSVNKSALFSNNVLDLLHTEKTVDSNNNTSESRSTGVVREVTNRISVTKEVGKSFKEIRDSFASPPLARISLKKPKVDKQKLALKTNSMFTINSESKPAISITFSLASSECPEAKQTSSNDNLDVLIPVVSSQSISSRSSRNTSRKTRAEGRAHSECDFNRENTHSEAPRDAEVSVPASAHSCSVPIYKVPVTDNFPQNSVSAVPQSSVKLPPKKPSILYLSMDRIMKDTRRKHASSCTDLVQHSKFGRVEELINESLGERRRQADTLPYSLKNSAGASFSSSNNSSFSGEDAFSPTTESEPRHSVNDGRGGDSDSSGDNYGTLEDDDDDDGEDDYVVRDELNENLAEKKSEVDSRASTLSASTDVRTENSLVASIVVDDEIEADDTFSFCSSSFDDFSNRNSELIDSYNNNNNNNYCNNEIKNLSFGESPDLGLPFRPQLYDLSSSFFSSSTSSANSSNLSLNLFNPCSKETPFSASQDVSRGRKEHIYESLPDINQLAIEKKKKQKDPFLVAKEIMTSEEKFIQVLKLLVEDFPDFIKSERAQGRAGDGPADVRHLIHDLPNLQQVNKELLKELKQRIENWDADPRIADIFVRTGHFLKLYTNYIKSFSRVVQEFDAVRRKNPDFDRAVSEFENSPACNMLALRHYMLKPIQRIPQYKLLLQEYLKCLTPESPDYANAKDAIPIVAGVSEHANESVRNWENQCKIISIQNMLGGYRIVQPDRKFIKEGRLMKLSRKEMQARMFFLFNDLLLYTTPVGANSYRVNQAISLDGLTVNSSAAEDVENEFNIISVERSFTVAASSKEEKDQWVLALEGAVLEHMETKTNLEMALKLRRTSCQDSSTTTSCKVPSAPKASRGVSGNGVVSMYESNFKVGERAPVWIQDERASMCMACTREFSVTFRRHHCRGCGKIVCSTCSKCRAPLKYNGFKAARVCMDCYKYLKNSIVIHEEGGVIASTTANESGSDSASEYLISRDPPAGGQPNTPFKMRSLSLLFKGNPGPLSRSLSKPSILTEVQAFDSSSEMSGFLLQLEKKKWKRFWFVLKNQVLYTFRAMQDKAAIRTMPLLSYQVQDGSSGLDNDEKTFEIFHDGLPPVTLRAETCPIKFKWIDALQKAMTV